MRRFMKIIPVMGVCLLLSSWAATADELAEADRLFAQGGLENLQQSIALTLKAVEQNPGSFEANWKCARAHREYANQAKRQDAADWKKTCAEHGKTGMQYAQKAIDLQPDKPDGYYYYGVSVGIYSDGVSIVTALAEGLKDKTQSSFEKAYAIDKSYKQGGPMLSLGRVWSVQPWPLLPRIPKSRLLRQQHRGPPLSFRAADSNGWRRQQSRSEGLPRKGGPIPGHLFQELGDAAIVGDWKVMPHSGKEIA
jgi:tetratricopeptide (TPR) repeat protein